MNAPTWATSSPPISPAEAVDAAQNVVHAALHARFWERHCDDCEDAETTGRALGNAYEAAFYLVDECGASTIAVRTLMRYGVRLGQS